MKFALGVLSAVLVMPAIGFTQQYQSDNSNAPILVAQATNSGVGGGGGAGRLGAAAQGSAATSGFYLGLGFGQSQSNFDTGGTLAAGASPAGSSFGPASSAFSWKEYAGYEFNRNLAVELDMVSLGKYDFSATIPGKTPAGGSTGKLTLSGMGIAAVGTLPMSNNFSVFGKLGAFHSDMYATTTVNMFKNGTANQSSDHKWVPNYGIGVKYDVNRNVVLRGEVERFQGIGSNSYTVRTNTNLYTVGAALKF